MLGGALGLAILASVAAARTSDAIAAGTPTLVALTDGYHAAFAVGGVFAIGAAALGLRALRIAAQPAFGDAEANSGELATAAD
jgi:hypothetical protein